MDSKRWEQVQSLFHQVADLPEQEQIPKLTHLCSDPALRAEVLAMLREDRSAAFTDKPLESIARDLVDLKQAYTTIGPYRIERVLGEGGVGTVFLGRRTDLDSVAAIKVLRDAWISPARRARFASEQRMLAQLEHPNIARLFDADTLADGTPFFVMEYVDGLPLDEYCETNDCSISERLKLFRAVCEAVQFAHGQAVIHRDLKPSNILVKADGAVKLLDFGIAKQEQEAAPGDRTRTGLQMLTPAYASPEQILGQRATVHSDVYSLGVILYQLLAGKLPFDISDLPPSEVASTLVERNPVKPSAAAAQCVAEQSQRAKHNSRASRASWADLDVLCLTAMHKDVQKRYSSTEALIRDVDHYLRGEPLEARPDSLTYRTGKFVRRHRGAVASGLTVLIAGTALVIFFTARLAAERNVAVAEAARTQRIQRFMLDLFEGGDKESGPANDLRVVTLIDRGVQQARGLDQDPLVQAELYQTLGDIYQKLGSLDRADALLNSALERRRVHSGNDSLPVAENLVALGLLRIDQAKLDEAESFVRQGLGWSQQHLPPNHPTVATATDALGRVLEEKGLYDQAIVVLTEAVRLRSLPGASSSDLASSLYELSNAHFYAGHYKESEALNQRVLKLRQQLYGDAHPSVAEALVNLGAIQQDLGNYKQAEQFHRRALEITRTFYGDQHYRTAANLTMIGRSLVYQKRFDEAVTALDQALAIQERVLGKEHPRVASVLNDLGNVAVMRAKYADARASFARMADIYRGTYGGKHYLIGTALSNQGSAFMAEREHARAEALFREALEMYTQTLPPGHLNIAIARIKLGRTLLRQKRYDEAQRELASGYDTLTRQASPSVSWLNSARTDLAEVYEKLKEPGKAQSMRKEMAAVTTLK